MLMIHSYFLNDRINQFRNNIPVIAKQAKVSNLCLKKNNHTTILYTDNESFPFFKDIPYDDIKIIDPREFGLPNLKQYWALTKFIPAILTKEPFLHSDIDLFLPNSNSILNDISLDNSIITMHYEPWVHSSLFNILPSNIIKQVFDIDSSKAQVYNFSIFGGKDIQTIQSAINRLIAGIKNNLQVIDDILMPVRSDPYDRNWRHSVFAEQYILPAIISQIYSKPISVLMPETIGARSQIDVRIMMKQRDILHLWTLKKTIEQWIGLSKMMDILELYYKSN